MQERIIFREMLSEIQKLADEKGNRLTVEEIREFFSNAHLEEEQMAMIYEYLAGQKILVEGYSGKDAKEQEQPRGESLPMEDTIRMYLEDLETILPVEAEEEEKLFLLAAAQDTAARNRLTELYLRMVCEVAHTYAYGALPVSDLIQEGNVALMTALQSMEIMDCLQDYRMYLYRAVREAMEQAVAEQSDRNDMDEKIAHRADHLKESVDNLERDLEHQVSVSELSAYLEMPIEEIRDILRMAGDEIDVKQ